MKKFFIPSLTVLLLTYVALIQKQEITLQMGTSGKMIFVGFGYIPPTVTRYRFPIVSTVNYEDLFIGEKISDNYFQIHTIYFFGLFDTVHTENLDGEELEALTPKLTFPNTMGGN